MSILLIIKNLLSNPTGGRQVLDCLRVHSVGDSNLGPVKRNTVGHEGVEVDNHASKPPNRY